MKSTNNFGVRFIIRHSKSKLSGALIYARITVNEKRTEISLNKTIEPSLWDAKNQIVKGSKELVNRINPFLDETRLKLIDCYRQLKEQKALINPDAIKRLYAGDDGDQCTLMSLIRYHETSSRILLSKGTMKNYGATEKYLHKFLQYKYRVDDIRLTNLNYQFITQFELFLRTTTPLVENNPLGNNGVMKHMERLRKIVTMGFKLEWIDKDPFILYKLKFQRTEKDFLIDGEITSLETTALPNERLNKARDIFLFSCYTGLAYIDMAKLRRDNIMMGIDKEYWLRTTRQKTEIKVSVPLLPQALALLDKYKDDPLLIKKGRVLPYISNQKVNEYLKEIATHCKIEKYMTFHLARHTFATTITLNNGIPLETVSKMLGHTKLSTTQIYVHVLERKISDDMKALQIRIIKDIKECLRGVKDAKQFGNAEIDHCSIVFQNLLNSSLENIEQLLVILSNEQLQMKDDERLKRIDALYADMQDKYAFSSSFSEEMAVLTVQRMHQRTDIEISKILNGLQ